MRAPPQDCRGCRLCLHRTTVVMPSGDPGSPVVFVGEAPGENEDLEGVPFVGRAGSILDRAMADAGISRGEVMITNTVKCRPPGNRDPTEDEMSACRQYLISELEGRRLVVGLGKSSVMDLMGYRGRMDKIVNRVTRIKIGAEEVDFLPAYHPMACVYMKEARESLAETMRIVKEVLR